MPRQTSRDINTAQSNMGLNETLENRSMDSSVALKSPTFTLNSLTVT